MPKTCFTCQGDHSNEAMLTAIFGIILGGMQSQAFAVMAKHTVKARKIRKTVFILMMI